jgi:hypothetical protein
MPRARKQALKTGYTVRKLSTYNERADAGRNLTRKAL